MKTDHWFYGLFQSIPDLITLLLPEGASSAPPLLSPDAPGDALYRFEAPELKATNHRLDGAFWPRSAETGTPEQPVVLLEVQMHAKPGVKHRLGAQSFHFLQLHPKAEHLARLGKTKVIRGRMALVFPSLLRSIDLMDPQERRTAQFSQHSP